MRPVEQAAELARSGHLAEAEQAFLEIRNNNPDHPGVLRSLGAVQLNLGKLEDATENLTRATELRPDDAFAHSVLGATHHQAGRGEQALEGFSRAAELDPSSVTALCGMATVLQQMGDNAAASEAIDRALASAPGHIESTVHKARLLRRAGDLDAARKLLEPVIERLPDDDTLAPVLYEHARILDKQGKYDAAFNAALRANAAFSRLPASRLVDATEFLFQAERNRAIDAKLFARWKGEPSGKAPVFLVGMPRSGTTMTEQILAAHPDIVTTGERPIMSPVLLRLNDIAGPNVELGELLDTLAPEQIDELRELYQRSAEPIRATKPDAAVLVDKLPGQFVNIPAIARVFPDAKLIVCIRDPRDTYLSCLFQEFAPNPATVNCYTPDATASLYESVMGMWLDIRDRVGLPTLEIRYEDTTANLETGARRLLEFVGVGWDDAVLRFHEQRRFISTPSFEPVNTPVHTGAHGRWKNYRDRLGPILPRLTPFVEKLGYEADG